MNLKLSGRKQSKTKWQITKRNSSCPFYSFTLFPVLELIYFYREKKNHPKEDYNAPKALSVTGCERKYDFSVEKAKSLFLHLKTPKT